MGSISDLETMKYTQEIFDEFDINYDVKIISAHRDPIEMAKFAKDANKEYDHIIAAAGGAAHLPGMVASMTTLPVIGVPIKSNHLKGVDSFLSIAQMPSGVPVPTMAIGKSGAINAALYIVRILAIHNKDMYTKLNLYIRKLKQKVKLMQKSIEK